MKQKRSSANPFTHTFSESLKSTNIVVTLFMLAVMAFMFFSMLSYPLSYRDPYMESPTAKDQYIYYLFAPNELATVFACGLMLVAGILMGLSSFRFITSKKTVNVYYSLGIKREKLFLAHYLSGALLLVVGAVLSVMVGVVMNLIYIGSSFELWQAATYYMMAFATIALFSYSVTAAVLSSVGTVFEGGIFSVIISFLPTFLLSSVQFLMNKLVWGNPFGVAFVETGLTHQYNSPSLVTHFSYLTPLTAFSSTLVEIADREKPLNADQAEKAAETIYELAASDYLTDLFWLIAIAAIFFLGMYLFKRRRAEISGFIGTNRVLNNVGIFVVAIFTFSVIFTSSPLQKYAAFGIALFAALLVFVILDAVLRRSFKEFKRDLVFLPMHLAVITAIFFIFSTGLFGYSKRVPAAEDIKSVSVSTVGVQSFFSEYYPMREDILVYPGSNEMISGFESEKDIKLIRDIHAKIAELNAADAYEMWKFSADHSSKRLASRIQFTYYLKNGKTVRRSFRNVSAGVIEELLKIYDTERFKKAADEALSPDTPIMQNERARLLRSEGVIVKVYPKDLSYIARLNLTSEQRNELYEALRQDIAEQTYKERYFPEKPPLGVISIVGNNYTDFDKGIIEVIEDENGRAYEKAIEPPSKADDIIKPPSGEPWDILDNSPTIAMHGTTDFNIDFVITEDMERTIKFLKDNNMIDAFKGSEKKYTSVQLVSIERSFTFQPFMLKYGFDFHYDAFGKSISKAKSNEEYRYDPLENQKTYTVTDAETIKVLKDISYLTYFSSGTGYAAVFNAEDGTAQYLYIPASKMPAALAGAVRNFDTEQLRDFNLSNY